MSKYGTGKTQIVHQEPEIIYVKFQVVLSDSEYFYQENKKATADATMTLPRSVLSQLDPGDVLLGLLQVALAEYDVSDKEETK